MKPGEFQNKEAAAQEKDVPSKPRVGRKSRERHELSVGAACLLTSPEPSGVFSGPRMGHQHVGLKQKDCQVLLRRDSQSLRATGKSRPVGLEKLFIEGRGRWAGSADSPWLFIG